MKTNWIFLILLLNLVGCIKAGTLTGGEPYAPSLSVQSLPTNVPEGYPYYGKVQVDNLRGGEEFSLVDNTCAGLEIDKAEGVLAGVLLAKNGESCSYKVKTKYRDKEAITEEIKLTFGPQIKLKFDQTVMEISKLDTNKVLTLKVNADANYSVFPFETYFDYSIYSSNNIFDLLSLGLTYEKIHVNINESFASVDIKLNSNSISISNVEEQDLILNIGAPLFRPRVRINILPDSIPKFIQVSAGEHHTCAISLDQKLYCWGTNTSGEVGFDPAVIPIAIAPKKIGNDSWKSVSTGGEHTCGIQTDNSLWCWGQNNNWQLGEDGSIFLTEISPKKIGMASWLSVSSGGVYTCGIQLADNSLWCWGNNINQRLGFATDGNYPITN